MIVSLVTWTSGSSAGSESHAGPKSHATTRETSIVKILTKNEITGDDLPNSLNLDTLLIVLIFSINQYL